MNVETIVNDVKGRVEPIVAQGKEVVARGQEVVLAGFETLKTANSIVVESVQTLVKANVETGKELFAAAQTSFEKAKTDGIKTVAANPVAYLPEGKDLVVAAYNDAVTLVTKTGDELVKTFKQGYETINAKLTGEVEEVVAVAKKTVKKAAAKTKKAIKAAA
ncbi:MAG: phasin family protein [Stenotrophobium sp.]